MTYLITTQEVKSNTVIGGNVDGDKIKPLIYDIQIMVLENILGTKLYDKIVTDFVADTLAGHYLELFNDYIKPILWHSVHADYLRTGNVIASNAGVFEHSPEDGNVSDLERIKYSAKQAQSKADVYIDRCERWLCDKDLIEFTSDQDNDYDQSPSNVEPNTGWFLGGTAFKRNNKTRSTGGGDGDYLELE
jgi:hypothetical protein